MWIRLLGPVAVTRAGVAQDIPRSRKVRGLLAFLALNGPTSRSRLCELFWDVPSDPRGELRWALSKLRNLIDDDSRRRVIAGDQDQIALDLSDCAVDALELDRTVTGRLADTALADLRGLGGLCQGELIDGTELDDNPDLSAWLSAQRHRFRDLQVRLLAELAAREPAGSDERLRCLEAWLLRTPFDPRAHVIMLEALTARGRGRDAEAHLTATIRAFEQEGLDWAPVRDAWRASRAAAIPRVEPVTAAVEPPAPVTAPVIERPQRRARVAVMPFTDSAATGESHGLATGLTDDIITRLAKLRALFVIARGSTCALVERGIDPLEAGRLLDVQYVVTGHVRRHGEHRSVRVEVTETQDARVVWSDELGRDADETFLVLDAIVDRIVASIAEEIEAAETARAVLKPPSSLDAWESYHRGLWHMYRFNGPDNREASHFFSAAVKLDPTFARAHAGLSFTHFQNAFLSLTGDRDAEIAAALATATRSVAADDRDPAAHWAMGRALWLIGDHADSLDELQRSIELSPNFALGHYTLGFVHSQSGDPGTAIAATNHARRLSPFDPLQFAMMASRAVAHVRLGEFDEAAAWAVKATRRPNAHVHILAIAATCLALTQRRDEAAAYLVRIREQWPGYDVESLLRAFHLEPDASRRFRSIAATFGFDR